MARGSNIIKRIKSNKKSISLINFYYRFNIITYQLFALKNLQNVNFKYKLNFYF